MKGTMASVADLVSKLHENIDEIHKTIASLSDTSGHDVEIDRLEKERDEKLEEIRKAHEESLRETVEAEKKREEEIGEQIRKEEEEIAERRRREDEERKAKIESDLKEREKVRQEAEEKRRLDLESKQKGVMESVEEEMERLEDEMERKMEEGKKTLNGLDARRKEINKQISEELERPTVLPQIQYRSRKKTLQNNQQPDLLATNENKDVEVNGETPDTSTSREVDAPENEVSNTTAADSADGIVSEPAQEVENGTTDQPEEPETTNTTEAEPQSQASEAQAPEQSEMTPGAETEYIKTEETPEQENIPESSFLGAQDKAEEAVQPAEPPVEESHDETDAQPAAVDDPVQQDAVPEEATEEPVVDSTSTEDMSKDPVDNTREEAISSTEPAQPLEQDVVPEGSENRQESTSNHDSHESPEDRAAREEIEKLNEEIRKAMEEEEKANTVADEVAAADGGREEDEKTSADVEEPAAAESASSRRAVEHEPVENHGEEEAEKTAIEPVEETAEAQTADADATSTEAVAEDTETSDDLHASDNHEATNHKEQTQSKETEHGTTEPEKEKEAQSTENISKDDTADTAPVLDDHEAKNQASSGGDEKPAEKSIDIDKPHVAKSQLEASDDTHDVVTAPESEASQSAGVQPSTEQEATEKVEEATTHESAPGPSAEESTSDPHETHEVEKTPPNTQNQETEAASDDEAPATTNTQEPVQPDNESLLQGSELPDGTIIKPELVQHVLSEANDTAAQDGDVPGHKDITEVVNGEDKEEEEDGEFEPMGKEALEANGVFRLETGLRGVGEVGAREGSGEARDEVEPDSASDGVEKAAALGEAATSEDVETKSVNGPESKPEPMATEHLEANSVSDGPAETTDAQLSAEEGISSSTEGPEPSTEEHAEATESSNSLPETTETRDATEEESPVSTKPTKPIKSEEASDEAESAEEPASSTGVIEPIVSEDLDANNPSHPVVETSAAQVTPKENEPASMQSSEPVISEDVKDEGLTKEEEPSSIEHTAQPNTDHPIEEPTTEDVRDEVPTKEEEPRSTEHTKPTTEHHVEEPTPTQPTNADTASSHTEPTTEPKEEEVPEPVSQTEIPPTEEHSTGIENSDSHTRVPSGERADENEKPVDGEVEAKSMEVVVPDEGAVGENEESEDQGERGEFEGEGVNGEYFSNEKNGRENVEQEPVLASKEEIAPEEDVASPGPREFEGSGGARLTLDVWSPAASPTFGRDSQGDGKVEEVQENGSKEMVHQEPEPSTSSKQQIDESHGAGIVGVPADLKQLKSEVEDEPRDAVADVEAEREQPNSKSQKESGIDVPGAPTEAVQLPEAHEDTEINQVAAPETAAAEATMNDSIDADQKAHNDIPPTDSVKPLLHIGNLIQEQYAGGPPKVSDPVIDSEPHTTDDTPKAKALGLEPTLQPQPAYEDPEDVRAREEIARLNAEFLKAIAEEQAADETKIAPTAIQEDQERRGSHESADDIATREEIERLNKQIEEVGGEREIQEDLDDNASAPSVYSADHGKAESVSSTVPEGDKSLLQEDQDPHPNVPAPGHDSFLEEDSELETDDDHEWDEDSIDDAHEYAYLETIQEEQSNNDVLSQPEQSGDEDLPKSRFFHQPVGFGELVEPTSARSLGSVASTDADYSGDGYPEFYEKEPAVPFLGAEDVQHTSVTPQQEVKNNALRFQPTERPQTPAMQMFQPHDDSDSPHTGDSSENPADHNDSPDAGEAKQEPAMAAPEQQRVSTPEISKRLRPSNLQHRDGSLTPEHEALFSRISQIRNRLSPEPPINNPMLNWRTARYGQEQMAQHQSGAGVTNDPFTNDYQLPLSDAPAAEQPLDNALGAPITMGDARIRSDTVDTAPSFEHYADSEESQSGPATPPRHPQTDSPAINPSPALHIQSSEAWPLATTHGEYTDSDAPSDPKNTKASQDEFDPFNPEAYESPVQSPVHTQNSFHVTNVHIDQEYPPTSSSISQRSSIDSLPRGNRHPARNPTSTDLPTTQLPPNLHSVPWTATSLDDLPKENPPPPPQPPKSKSVTPSTSSSSLFQKTRSLFESNSSAASSPSQSANGTGTVSRPRALSAIFSYNAGSASPPKAAVAQRKSLQLGREGDERKEYDPDVDGEFLPRSLDGSRVYGGRGGSLDEVRGGEGKGRSLDAGRGVGAGAGEGKGEDGFAERGMGRSKGWSFSGLTGRGGRGVVEGEPLLGDENEG
ncbi:Cutinase transcription factor 1 beta protein [Rutstroemia sp. NJR-2017a BVV2]|nr:Cutinase transcription factor 1 beta protein [Rutstroemia sp. NJR-2017a BVV2]